MGPVRFVTCVTILLAITISTRCKKCHKEESFIYIDPDDYAKAMRLSLLFYEAQRSGELPYFRRITWRGDSALNDRGENGEDLTGGYYEGSGDFVKFGFTMAYTTTILAWGAITWPLAYNISDQMDAVHETVKWATDYFIKCHVSENVLYGQVGDFHLKHTFWGRPEEMNIARPAYKIDEEHPGTDLAGETSAALSAASILFKSVNPIYSAICLRHAKELFNFANNYRGLYHEAITNAAKYYKSSGYGDELTWAAAWLFKATGDPKYYNEAEYNYEQFNLHYRPTKFSYDNKVAGIQVLLAEETGISKYMNASGEFCTYAFRHHKRTPKGLLYYDDFGTLSYAANVAFICLKVGLTLQVGNALSHYLNAKEQIGYAMCATGRSYIVGYGHNWPQQAHCPAASCPITTFEDGNMIPSTCGWKNLGRNAPNPLTLYGALVSGPNEIDEFRDNRKDRAYTGVMLHYNAGFTSALAGLLDIRAKNPGREI